MNTLAATFGDICEFKYGKSLAADNRIPGDVVVYGSNGPVGSHNAALSDGPTIVIGRKGSVGEVHYCQGANWAIDTTYYIDATSTDCDLKWLSYALSSSRIRELNKAAAVPGLNRNDAYRENVLVPPLDEQKRIAAILDKADQLRQKRRQAIGLLDSLTQWIFLEMFGDPVTNPKGWAVKELASLERFLTSGSRGWAQYYADRGRPFIRIQNLKNGKLSRDDLVFVDAPDNAEARRTAVQSGDVLISITADLGRVAVVPYDLDGGANINQHIALFRPKGINSTFLASYLASEGGKRQFNASNRQGVKAGLNFNDIRSLKVPVPPLDMQTKFEEALVSLEARQYQYSIAENNVEDLFASLQHRAFSGQL
ncbi:restriction endonuclease subunit S [Kaistia sp. UC242_56]|uniref:restriction endonuclease subunit S n=1 Tax=Kaistia sp. UC242_56 TaxID=3374625 RepID=UPI0037AEE132